MVTWLLNECDIDIEAKEEYGMTPFLCAAENEQLAISKLLRQRDANLNARDKNGNNALHYACAHSGSVEMVTWLLDECKIGIETKGQFQYTPFLYAVWYGKLSITKLLKERGININAKDHWGNSALHLACLYSGSVEMINWLLDECKIDIETKGEYKRTPFLCAAIEGQLAIAKLLRQRGANVNAKDIYGYKALNLAKIFSKNKELIRYLENQSRIKTGRCLNFLPKWF